MIALSESIKRLSCWKGEKFTFPRFPWKKLNSATDLKNLVKEMEMVDWLQKEAT